MAEFDFDAAKQVIENGIGEAQSVLEDPAKMDALLDSLKEKAADLSREATELYAKKVREADAHWSDLSKQLEQFYNEHAGLRDMLNMLGKSAD